MSRRGTPSAHDDSSGASARGRRPAAPAPGDPVGRGGLVVVGLVSPRVRRVAAGRAANVISERRAGRARRTAPDRLGAAARARHDGSRIETGRAQRAGQDSLASATTSVVPVVEGVGDDELASGFGRFEESAGPGAGRQLRRSRRTASTHGQPRPGHALAASSVSLVLVETRDRDLRLTRSLTDPIDLVVDNQARLGRRGTAHQPGTGPGVQPGPARHLITPRDLRGRRCDTKARMVAYGRLTGHPADVEPNCRWAGVASSHGNRTLPDVRLRLPRRRLARGLLRRAPRLGDPGRGRVGGHPPGRRQQLHQLPVGRGLPASGVAGPGRPRSRSTSTWWSTTSTPPRPRWSRSGRRRRSTSPARRSGSSSTRRAIRSASA